MPRLLVATILVLFGALTAVALWHHGYWGIFDTMLQSWAGIQVLTDLTIALGLVLVWMWRDARSSGRTVWPYVAITLAAGVFGPLLYLVTRRPPAP